MGRSCQVPSCRSNGSVSLSVCQSLCYFITSQPACLCTQMSPHCVKQNDAHVYTPTHRMFLLRTVTKTSASKSRSDSDPPSVPLIFCVVSEKGATRTPTLARREHKQLSNETLIAPYFSSELTHTHTHTESH